MAWNEGLEAHPLPSFLRDPVNTARVFDAPAWGSLLRSARRANLLSRSALIALAADVMPALPEKMRFHFNSAVRVAESARLSTQRELRHIRRALAPHGIPCILLKGAAYIAGDLEAGKGRLMSDVDIMVPHNRLDETERALIEAGWMTTNINAYDQRYYRQWMHELPPMRHLDRGTSLDIHHTILPPTARMKPDVGLLWKSARELSGTQGFLVLAPVDMVLHSATHLFHEGEFPNGLRDLFDIDALLREFSSTPDFWRLLLIRAQNLDLERPLYYALRYASSIAGTPVPEAAMTRSQASAPPTPLRQIMDRIVTRSLGSVTADTNCAATNLSLLAMYVRSHYLRMPLHLLLPHLLRKQLRRDEH